MDFKSNLLLIIGLTVIASGCVNSPSKDMEESSKKNIDLKQEAKEIPYSNLANYPERVKGDAVRGRGKLAQVFGDGDLALILTEKVSPYQEPNYYGRAPVYAVFETDKKPENGTVVNYWGNVLGTETYENQEGRYMTVPKIRVKEFNTKFVLKPSIFTKGSETPDSADKVCLNGRCLYSQNQYNFTVRAGQEVNLTASREGYETGVFYKESITAPTEIYETVIVLEKKD